MVPIEEFPREKFFSAQFGGEDINANFWKILGHIGKHGGLCIQEPRLSADSAYITSKTAIRELVGSLLIGSALNCIGHRACIRGASAGASRENMHVELADMARRKELAGFQERNRLHRATMNGE